MYQITNNFFDKNILQILQILEYRGGFFREAALLVYAPFDLILCPVTKLFGKMLLHSVSRKFFVPNIFRYMVYHKVIHVKLYTKIKAPCYVPCIHLYTLVVLLHFLLLYLLLHSTYYLQSRLFTVCSLAFFTDEKRLVEVNLQD